MKIAVFYDLEKGGAWETVKQNIKFLTKNKEFVDIFSTKKDELKLFSNNYYVFENPHTNNVIDHLYSVLFKIRINQKKIANIINKNQYDLILIYPSIITQAPYLLRFLNSKNLNKTIYILHEPKREFYETTSYDYYQWKRIMSRLIRLPIKYIDKKNCSYAKHIISNSYYSKYIIQKIYNKNSYVIYPGMIQQTPNIKTIKNFKNILSVGMFSKIKGHHISFNQIAHKNITLNILGRKSQEFKYINNLAFLYNTRLKILITEDNKIKNKIYKKHSIFLANQINEPFGLTTLEAADQNCFVLGLNLGGTPEIIRHGLNGLLYPQFSLLYSQKTLDYILKHNKLEIIKTTKINWQSYSQKISKYYINKIKNEPNY